MPRGASCEESPRGCRWGPCGWGVLGGPAAGLGAPWSVRGGAWPWSALEPGCCGLAVCSHPKPLLPSQHRGGLGAVGRRAFTLGGDGRDGEHVCVCVCVCVLGGSRKAGFSQKTWVQAPWLPSGSDPRTNSSVEGLNGERRSQNHVDELGDS